MLRKLKWQIPGEILAARYNWCRGPAVEKHWSKQIEKPITIYRRQHPSTKYTSADIKIYGMLSLYVCQLHQRNNIRITKSKMNCIFHAYYSTVFLVHYAWHTRRFVDIRLIEIVEWNMRGRFAGRWEWANLMLYQANFMEMQICNVTFNVLLTVHNAMILW